MNNTVLIIAKKNDTYFEEVESAVLKRGLQTLSLRTIENVFSRLKVELFVAIVIDESLVTDAKGFINRLTEQPLGAITPLVLIQNQKITTDCFGLHKTLLDQAFNREGITPEALAEYLTETVKEAVKGIKKGDLDRVQVPAVYQAAHELNYSGALVFELKEERRIIYLQEGLIVSASSSNPQDFFGEFLCNKGFISNMQLKEALSYAKAKDLRLGNAVVQLQMIKPDILYPLLQEQLKNIVNRPFAWEKGNYFFLPNEKNHQDESIFKIPVNQCIYEGIKKNYSEQRLQKYFNGKDLLIQPNPNFSDHLSELILENKEKEFMKLLNVPRRMNELTQLSILPPKEILQLCFILQTIGICSTVDARTIANKPVVIVEKKMPLSNLATPMDLKSEKTEVPKTVEFSKPTIHLPETPPKNFSYGSFISGAISCGIILIGVYFGLHRHNSKKTILAVAREPAQCTTVVEKNLSEKSIVEKDASPAINSVALTLAIPPVAPKIESQKTAKPVLATAAVVNKSDQFESFLKQGKVYYKSGDLIRAKDFFLKALLLNPASSEVLIQLANLSYDMDNETDAMSYINRVLKNDGNNPDARQLLGSIYLMNSRNADAINQFKIVLKYSKDSKRKIEIEKILAKLSSK